MSKKITVGMAECEVGVEGDILESLGIGSCIAICFYCKEKKVGGMAHIMLSSSKNRKVNPLRFVDEAISNLIGKLLFKGCKKEEVSAKIFGGASMFSNSFFNVGKSNINSARKRLRKEGIQIIAEDTGGAHGRSIEFNISDGNVSVKKVGHDIEVY